MLCDPDDQEHDAHHHEHEPDHEPGESGDTAVETRQDGSTAEFLGNGSEMGACPGIDDDRLGGAADDVASLEDGIRHLDHRLGRF